MDGQTRGVFCLAAPCDVDSISAGQLLPVERILTSTDHNFLACNLLSSGPCLDGRSHSRSIFSHQVLCNTGDVSTTIHQNPLLYAAVKRQTNKDRGDSGDRPQWKNKQEPMLPKKATHSGGGISACSIVSKPDTG